MIVIKIVRHADGTIRLSMSKPCFHCAQILYSVGIKRVVYSNSFGQLVKTRIDEDEFAYSRGTGDYFVLD